MREDPRSHGGARLTRRGVCRSLLVLPLLQPAACARVRRPFRRGGGGDAAMLLPLSGEASALGRNMSRAATLGAADPEAALPVFDTADTAEGAALAARRALDGGARMLLGPLRGDQTPAVLDVAGEVPVVTFSNDDRLAGQGAFVMGITPAQSVAATFSFARAQGVGSVAVVTAPGPLGEATATAARQLAPAGGLTLAAVLTRPSEEPALLGALQSASGGTLPQAVLLPDGGSDLSAFAAELTGSGTRLMGSVQWAELDVASDPSLQGAWFAAPPPDRFLPFLDTFEVRFAETAGVVTALGHDAAAMAGVLRAEGSLDRRGLTREEGFEGVLGRFRFLEDGRCQRDLAVLTVEGGRIVPIGEVAAT